MTRPTRQSIEDHSTIHVPGKGKGKGSRTPKPPPFSVRIDPKTVQRLRNLKEKTALDLGDLTDYLLCYALQEAEAGRLGITAYPTVGKLRIVRS